MNFKREVEKLAAKVGALMFTREGQVEITAPYGKRWDSYTHTLTFTRRDGDSAETFWKVIHHDFTFAAENLADCCESCEFWRED